jgi:EpsI family protein
MQQERKELRQTGARRSGYFCASHHTLSARRGSATGGRITFAAQWGNSKISRKTLNESLRAPKTALLVGVLVIVALAAYWPASAGLWRYWIDQPSLGGHGTLVAALAVWLLIRSRSRIDAAATRPAPWALLLLIPCSIAALVFWRAGIQALYLWMLPVLIWLAVLAAFGVSVARIVAVPIGYLYFAMPAWNLLSAPLQELTLRMVAVLAPAIGLPATVSGALVSFPNGAQFVVTLACSGVAFLTQGLAVAALLGELEDATFGRRMRLLGSMVLVALVTNWVRVLLLLVVGYSNGMNNVIVSRDHLEFGYMLFVIVLVAFVWVATRRALPEAEVGAPILTKSQVRGGYAAAMVALVAGPILVTLLVSPGDGNESPAELRLPPGQNAWRGPLAVVAKDWRPVFVGAHSERHAAYRDASGHTVEAVAVGYPVQEQGRELVNESNSLLGDEGLSPLAVALVDADGSTYRELVAVDKEGNRSVIWSFYDIGGKTFVVPLLSQLWYGVRSLSIRPYSALFAFRVACVPSCAEARGILESFMQGMGSDLAVFEKAVALGSVTGATPFGELPNRGSSWSEDHPNMSRPLLRQTSKSADRALLGTDL